MARRPIRALALLLGLSACRPDTDHVSFHAYGGEVPADAPGTLTLSVSIGANTAWYEDVCRVVWAFWVPDELIPAILPVGDCMSHAEGHGDNTRCCDAFVNEFVDNATFEDDNNLLVIVNHLSGGPPIRDGSVARFTFLPGVMPPGTHWLRLNQVGVTRCSDGTNHGWVDSRPVDDYVGWGGDADDRTFRFDKEVPLTFLPSDA
jgi:hypothetical protein